MDKKTVYFKTPKGKSEGANLSRDLKRIFAFIDDKSPSDELAKRAPPSLRKVWNDIISELVSGDYIVGINMSVVEPEQRAAAPKSNTSNTSVSKRATEEPVKDAEPALTPAELAAKQKAQESERAKAELKAYFATAKVKLDAEAKAAREEAKARQEAEKAARARAEAEVKAQKGEVIRAQAESAQKAADLKVKQKAEEAARARAELESAMAAAKARSEADIKAETKASQEAEKAARARTEAGAKAQQAATIRAHVESVQKTADQAKQKADEAARIRAELEAAMAVSKARADADIRAKADAKARQDADKTARARAEADIKARGVVSREQAEAGMPMVELRANSELSDSMDTSEAQRLRHLENENNMLKKLLGEALLEIETLKTTFGGKH